MLAMFLYFRNSVTIQIACKQNSLVDWSSLNWPPSAITELKLVGVVECLVFSAEGSGVAPNVVNAAAYNVPTV